MLNPIKRIFLTNIWKKNFQTAKKAMQNVNFIVLRDCALQRKVFKLWQQGGVWEQKAWRYGQHLRQNHEKQKTNGIWNNWRSLLSHLVSISFLLWICSTSNCQGWILKYNEIGSVFVEFRVSIIQHWIYINFHFVPTFSFNLLQLLVADNGDLGKYSTPWLELVKSF